MAAQRYTHRNQRFQWVSPGGTTNTARFGEKRKAKLFHFGNSHSRAVYSLLLVFIFLIFLTPFPSARSEEFSQESENVEIVDMVLASIEEDPITLSELRQYLQSLGQTPPLNILDDKEALIPHLRDLISTKLLLKEAELSGVGVEKEQVDAYLEEIKKQNNLTTKEFEKFLTAHGLSKKAYREQIETEIIRTKLLSMRVRAKINVLEEDIDRYLTEHPELLPKKDEIRIEQVKLPGSQKKELEKIRLQVLNGADFKWIGNTNYLDLGFVHPSHLRKAIQEAVKNHETDDISPVVQIDSAVYLFKTTRPTGGLRSIPKDVRERIRQELYEKTFQEKLKLFLTKELPEKYHIDIKI